MVGLFLFYFLLSGGRGGGILWQNLREICLIISCKSTEISAVVLTVNPIGPAGTPPSHYTGGMFTHDWTQQWWRWRSVDLLLLRGEKKTEEFFKKKER